MSVQVKRRRDTEASLASFVGAQAELLVDTTNNRVQVHDGATPGGWPAAKLAEVLTNKRVAVADADYAALASDRTIAFTSLTAARNVSLPAASAFPTGTALLVIDESGACSGVSTITLQRAGSDTIDGATSAVLNGAYMALGLQSNGADAWTIIAQVPNVSAALVGIGTAPDPTNPLSVQGANALFSSASDIRIKVNKASPSSTASFLYQDGFSGRAEIGLTGDDNFHFKVSADGATWYDSLDIAASSGLVTAKFGLALAGATSGTTQLAAAATASGTLTLPAATDVLVGRATTDTLTNKTLNASNNTVSNLATSMFASSVVDTDGTLSADSDTRLASQKAVKTYVDAHAGGATGISSVALEAVTATDVAAVFVYDTTRDADGGAWRARCGGASYVNETLNTSTRGSRASIPSKILAVARAASLTLYDLDDTACSMWMVFTVGSGGNFFASVVGSIKQIVFLDGIMAVATSSRFEWVDFIQDTAFQAVSNVYQNANNIAARNSTLNQAAIAGSAPATTSANDVALARAPVAQPSPTRVGLPTPIIGIAGTAGAWVLRQDFYGKSASSSTAVISCCFDSRGNFWTLTASTLSVCRPVDYQTASFNIAALGSFSSTALAIGTLAIVRPTAS